jgi:hypothetical protein
MSERRRKPLASVLALAVSATLGAFAPATHAYQSDLHVFSIEDVQGGFDGSTYGPSGAIQRPEIFCGLPGSPDCPVDADGEPLVEPIVDKEGVTLYPIDSQFGFYVVDFVGAQEKHYDGDYMEGWAGNITDGDTVVGIKVSNAVTDVYKVKPPLGTWCQGLGGTSVKCSTEHYTVTEHVLSCHEVIPYSFADPVTGAQGTQSTPDGSLSVDCTNTDLDDEMLILVDGEPDTRLTDSTPGVQMDANDNTTVLNDIAVSSDYSVTLKDDGKALYRWGGLIKRPNDFRMYARLMLPDEWKERDGEGNLLNDFEVTKARLVVNHWITNNPNDQLRPEDLENEAATGRKPDYKEEPADPLSPNPTATVWRSINPCFEGDGDLIDNEDGTIDPTAIGVGTYFKNTPFAVTEPPAGDEPGANPYPFSADLTGAFTNAYYTTIERDPFEWSYEVVTDLGGGIVEHDFLGCAGPIDDPVFAALCSDIPAETPQASGPRWRLKANKFGQDIPGLEIPIVECSAPPFERDNIKYVVGQPVTTVIDLMDWNEEENGPSPLASSRGWVDSALYNPFITVVETVNGRQITSNGLPMSEDFDLAVYVKGDRKSTAVYNAQLFIEYEGEVTPPGEVDMALTELEVPDRVELGEESELKVKVTNNGPDAASGAVDVVGVSNRGDTEEFSASFADLAAGQEFEVKFDWTAPEGRPGTITWTATVTAEGDTNPDNDSATAVTRVRR